MLAAGLGPNVEADCAVHAQNYNERTTTAARVVNAEMPIFYNGGHIPVGAHRFNFFNSHFELESLPTDGWGYDHFPLVTQSHSHATF